MSVQLMDVKPYTLDKVIRTSNLMVSLESFLKLGKYMKVQYLIIRSKVGADIQNLIHVKSATGRMVNYMVTHTASNGQITQMKGLKKSMAGMKTESILARKTISSIIENILSLTTKKITSQSNIRRSMLPIPSLSI